MPPSVLVVDDDRDIASVITEVLIDEGYDAVAAFDGQQALDRAARHPIDLLVSDIRMPHIDGITLLHRLREQGWSKPVVLMSSVEMLEPGWHGVIFVRKPFDLDDLVELVNQILKQPDGNG